jgi:hypothetical protein
MFRLMPAPVTDPRSFWTKRTGAVAVQLDQHCSSGFYTDGVLAMFRQIRHSFSWWKSQRVRSHRLV